MLYLLDANVLIDANRDYYPIGRVGEFWAWLLNRAETGQVKLPQEVYEEISAGNDEVAQWVKAHRETLLLREAVDRQLVEFVVSNGYAPDLTDEEIIAIGRDPFLVAYALAGEKPINTFELIRRLDFRTDWRAPA